MDRPGLAAWSTDAIVIARKATQLLVGATGSGTGPTSGDRRCCPCALSQKETEACWLTLYGVVIPVGGRTKIAGPVGRRDDACPTRYCGKSLPEDAGGGPWEVSGVRLRESAHWRAGFTRGSTISRTIRRRGGGPRPRAAAAPRPAADAHGVTVDCGLRTRIAGPC